MTTRREDLVAAAKRLAASKEASLDDLINATETVADINDQLAAAHGQWEQKLRAAKKAGWTDQELTTIGFDLSGGAQRSGRSSGRRNNKKDTGTSNTTAPASPGSAAPAASSAAGSTT